MKNGIAKKKFRVLENISIVLKKKKKSSIHM